MRDGAKDMWSKGNQESHNFSVEVTVESRLKYLEQALGDSEAKHREEKTGTIWDHSCWQKTMDVDVMNVMEFI